VCLCVYVCVREKKGILLLDFGFFCFFVFFWLGGVVGRGGWTLRGFSFYRVFFGKFFSTSVQKNVKLGDKKLN